VVKDHERCQASGWKDSYHMPNNSFIILQYLAIRGGDPWCPIQVRGPQASVQIKICRSCLSNIPAHLYTGHIGAATTAAAAGIMNSNIQMLG